MREFTALDLLDAYLEVVQYDPSFCGSVTEQLTGNPVGLYCFERLELLAQAFEVPLVFFSAEPAPAVRARQDEWGEDVEGQFAQQVDTYLLGSEARPYERGRHGDDLGQIFEQYCKFLVALQEIQRFNEGWFVARNAGSRYLIETTNDIIKDLDNSKIQYIRLFVARVLDPAGRRFTKAELVGRFGKEAKRLI